MKISSGGNFNYRETSSSFRLLNNNNLSLDLISNVQLRIPKGVWLLDTKIELNPGQEIIEQNGVQELYVLGLDILTFLYTSEQNIILTIQAKQDIIIEPNTVLAILNPFLSANAVI